MPRRSNDTDLPCSAPPIVLAILRREGRWSNLRSATEAGPEGQECHRVWLQLGHRKVRKGARKLHCAVSYVLTHARPRREAAYIFAKWGAKVVLACRDAPSYEQHPTETIKELLGRGAGEISEDQLEWWEVDFASIESIKAFGRRWRESGRVCDILCNNAGLSVSKRTITKDGFELTNQVNFLGHCLMTLYVLPSMKKAPAPRIVNVRMRGRSGSMIP